MTALPETPDDRDLEATGGGLLPEPGPWTDALTGVDGPRLWDRLVTSEQARLRRHGGRVTVVLLDLIGFGELATWVGRDVAVQAFGRLAHVVAGEIRSSDHIARVGADRFAILLIETDEVRTLNFIDRVLRACQPELDALGGLVRIGVGWASPTPVHDLAGALTLAEERLSSDFFATRGRTAAAG